MKEFIETNSPEETFDAGRKLGMNAKPGEIYTLNGDLGVGKTVFTQGVAAGLGILEHVNSPTFTIFRFMRAADCPFITSMYTASVMLRRWMRSAMKIILRKRTVHRRVGRTYQGAHTPTSQTDHHREESREGLCVSDDSV